MACYVKKKGKEERDEGKIEFYKAGLKRLI